MKVSEAHWEGEGAGEEDQGKLGEVEGVGEEDQGKLGAVVEEGAMEVGEGEDGRLLGQGVQEVKESHFDQRVANEQHKFGRQEWIMDWVKDVTAGMGEVEGNACSLADWGLMAASWLLAGLLQDTLDSWPDSLKNSKWFWWHWTWEQNVQTWQNEIAIIKKWKNLQLYINVHVSWASLH